MPALTTVVIATRDRRDSLLHTLDKTRELPERPPVIVVDNGSSDGSPRAVRQRHPDVLVLEPGCNLGAGGRTFGSRHAATPFVAFSDDDSWWAPGALQRAGKLLETNDRLALVAARIVVEPDGRIDPTCHAMADSPLAPDPVLGRPRILGFVACGAIVRRAAFLAVGGFRPELGVGGEESLLAIDLHRAGWTLIYADHVVAHHQPARGGRAGRGTTQPRNALWTAWLRRPLPRAIAITAGVLRDAGRDAPTVLAEAARGVPWILRARRVVPSRTEAALRILERAP
jgi:GT2 family glycosyltransferase